MTQIEDLAFWKSLTDEDFFNTAAPAKSRDEGLKLLKRRDTSINRVQFSLRAERLNLDIFTSTLKRGSPLDKQRRRGQKRLEEKARALKARANHLTLVHAHHRPTTSSWQDLSDEQFREIVERSKNISQAFKEMKVSHTTANKHILLEWAGFLEIDISHFPKMPIDSVPHWKLTAAIERSTSYTALARDLRITQIGRAHV